MVAPQVMLERGAFNFDCRFPLIFLSQAKSIDCKHLTRGLAPGLSRLALRQHSEAVHRFDKFTHRIPNVKTAAPCRETSKRRKEFIYPPAKSCQSFCVMDAPEIHQAPGLVVVSEFLTAIQANDVSFPAKDRSASE
jgi:hypothetical protein